MYTPAYAPAPTRATFRSLDRAFQAQLAQLTGGVSPAAIGRLYASWGAHLALSPGKQLALAHKAARKVSRLASFTATAAFRPDAEPCIEPLPQDHRFDSPLWRQAPHSFFCQSFLLAQQWWSRATTDVDGVAPSEERALEFMTRQWLDAFSPSNFPWSNPEVVRAAVTQGGMNFVRGAFHWAEDVHRTVTRKPPVGAESFRVGHGVAATEGKVVFRNRLMELIQYAPTTEEVYAEPILITPAWIMKYYVLDLTPKSSLVRYLVDRGHTVFMISWKNPTAEDRDLGMEDYRRLGPMAALDVIQEICPDRSVHGVGYCLGGTLLTIAAAAMAREGDERLASLTQLAAQVDFTEAGELTLFIGESEVAFLEAMMWDQGYLDTRQMAGAFQLLRSNDLIWSRLIRHYLLGERNPTNALAAWSADATRMPYRMHSEYLRKLFLNNDLVQGRYEADGRPVTLSDIRVPIFALGTETDHIAPWRSVYKIHLPADTEITFCLTSGGHNGGIVSEPGHPRRHFRIATKQDLDKYIDPDTWSRETPTQSGSWWPAFADWIARRSSEAAVPPPSLGGRAGVLDDAPGTYVYG